jgi:aspartyl/glutamyl-tRNA(Asn/Gln) amidotransferase C subunit
MNIGAADVRHVAALAELAVDDAELPVLAEQLGAIVNFVARLDALVDAASANPAAVSATSEPTALRDDVVDPIPLHRTPAEMAPAFAQGFYVVPRRIGVHDE